MRKKGRPATADKSAADRRAADNSTAGFPLVPLAGAAVAAAVVLALFAPTLSYEFINYDLFDHIFDNDKIRSLGPANLARIFTEVGLSYYPLRDVSFAIDYAIWEFDPFGYNLSNLLIHLANTLVFYWLMLRLLRAGWGGESFPADATRRTAAALIACVLFAVHPVVVEPVCWQGAREELLMLLFTLLAVHAHHSARLRYPPPGTSWKANRRSIIAFHGLAAVACGAACMSSALGAAAALIVTGYELARPGKTMPLRIVGGTAPLWLIAIATILLKRQTQQETIEFFGSMAHGTDRIWLVLHTYAMNVKTLLWPSGLTLFYPRYVPERLTEPAVLVGAGLVLAMLAALWLSRRRALILFGLLWFTFALAPSAQVIPHQIARADRFVYSPLCGLAILCCAILWGTMRASRRAGRATAASLMVVAAMVLMVLMVLSHRQMLHWRSDFTLFSRCIAIHPTEVAYNNRGTAWGKLAQQRFEQSYRLLERSRAEAQRGNLQQANTLHDQAMAIKAKARAGMQNAVDDLVRSLDMLSPDDKRVFARLYNIANAYVALAEYEKAVAYCTRGIESAPDEAALWLKRGQSYMNMGRYESARADLSRVLALDAQAELKAGARGLLAAIDKIQSGR